MFDINDFDETLPGPWEWDVKRLMASFEIAGRNRGFRRRPSGARSCLPGSRSTGPRLKEAAGRRNLDVWYAHVEAEKLFAQLKSRSHREAAAPKPRRTSPRPGPGTACRRSPS